jgi:hypothetical protein
MAADRAVVADEHFTPALVYCNSGRALETSSSATGYGALELAREAEDLHVPCPSGHHEDEPEGIVDGEVGGIRGRAIPERVAESATGSEHVDGVGRGVAHEDLIASHPDGERLAVYEERLVGGAGFLIHSQDHVPPRIGDEQLAARCGGKANRRPHVQPSVVERLIEYGNDGIARLRQRFPLILGRGALEAGAGEQRDSHEHSCGYRGESSPAYRVWHRQVSDHFPRGRARRRPSHVYTITTR